MRCMLLAGLVALLPTTASAEGPSEIETFRDWVVGCDNRLSCTAIGMVGEFDQAIAYLKVTRTGESSAEPVIVVTALDENSAGTVELALSVEGGMLPVETLTANAAQSYPSAVVPAAQTRSLLDSLLAKNALSVRSKGGDPAAVSLAGMSAALRWMDAAQGRAGGVTALVARGPAAAAPVPEPDATVPVKALVMTELDPVPPAPKGAPERDEFCNQYAADVAYGFPDGRQIYGVCSFSGAYNTGYDYVLVSADGTSVEPIDFPGPGGSEGIGASGLVNPGLSEDGKRLSAFNKGRGIGDCGDSGEWVFDGTAFQLVSYALMPECRGVASEDWPVLVSIAVE